MATTTTTTTTSSFDASGFSAVANFFGKSEEDGAVSKNTPTPKKSKGRLGVGASAAISKPGPSDATKKLMKIGKRKRKNAHDGDDNEEDEEEEEADEEDDDDDDEEEGRTTIEEKTKPVAPAADDEPVDDKPKKKKKKGKKERQAEAAAAEEGTPAADDEEVTPVEPDAESNRKSKRKRRKVRSRQKNIYKDSRTMEQKPKHLQLGQSDFEGRPMTAETRARLSLPAKAERKRPVSTSRPTNSMNDGALAIDELMADDNIDDDATGQVVTQSDAGDKTVKKSKKTSKVKKASRKKTKYKNLR